MVAPIGKTFEITGTVKKIERQGSEYMVILEEKYSIGGITAEQEIFAYFGSDQRESLLETEAGRKLTFIGKVTLVYDMGWMRMSSNFQNCRVIKAY